MQKTGTDVVVAGAGPAGLMVAAELGLAGVRVIVLEQLPGRAEMAKANGLQPRTAEVFDLRGLMNDVRAVTLPRDPVGGHFGGLPVPLDYRPWRTRHLTILNTPQNRVEEVLEHPLIGTRMPDLDLVTEDGPTRFSTLMRPGREIQLNLDPEELGAAVVRIRPDGYISWAA